MTTGKAGSSSGNGGTGIVYPTAPPGGTDELPPRRRLTEPLRGPFDMGVEPVFGERMVVDQGFRRCGCVGSIGRGVVGCSVGLRSRRCKRLGVQTTGRSAKARSVRRWSSLTLPWLSIMPGPITSKVLPALVGFRTSLYWY